MIKFQFTNEYIFLYTKNDFAFDKTKDAIRKIIDLIRNRKVEAVKYLSRKIGVKALIDAFRPPIKKREIVKELLMWGALPTGLGAAMHAIGLPIITALIAKSGILVTLESTFDAMRKRKELKEA